LVCVAVAPPARGLQGDDVRREVRLRTLDPVQADRTARRAAVAELAVTAAVLARSCLGPERIRSDGEHPAKSTCQYLWMSDLG
jgi:hypothetical protein